MYINQTSSKGQFTLPRDGNIWVNKVDRIPALITLSCSTNILLGKMMLPPTLSPQKCLTQNWHMVDIPYLLTEWVNPRWGIKWSYTVKIPFSYLSSQQGYIIRTTQNLTQSAFILFGSQGCHGLLPTDQASLCWNNWGVSAVLHVSLTLQ